MFALKKKSRLKSSSADDEEEGTVRAEHFKARSKLEQLTGMGALRLLGILVFLCILVVTYFTFIVGNHGCGVIYPCRHRIVDLLLNPSFSNPAFKQSRILDAAIEAEDQIRFSSSNMPGSHYIENEPEDADDGTTSSSSSGISSSSRLAPRKSESLERTQGYETRLANIVFGIAASASLWENRKEYVKLWWRPGEMRGFVWLDKPVKNWSATLPPQRISEDTSKFLYANKKGSRAALRISRVISETFRTGGLEDVHWFVMGDDDTVFVPENLVKVLSKYDHRRFYYIGSHSESHTQNIHFSYNMAYGGGGFAISYPLAKALEKMQDKCIQNYPGLYGSDDRMQACMAELGVPLTKEPGFHQFDIYGDAFGLLAAHPVTPLVSIHHLDIIDPIFPNMTRVEALKHLKRSLRTDPGGTLQQSICYDKWRRWSISVSWGYAVQVYKDLISPRTLELPMRTFVSWYRKDDDMAFPFNTRPFDKKKPCDQPAVFFLKDVGYREDGQTSSTYVPATSETDPQCRARFQQQHAPASLNWVHVVKEEHDESWHLAPRRQCCRVLNTRKYYMEISIGDCEAGETII